MKNKFLYLICILCIGLFTSCCQCMNCPGSAIWTGTGSDDICKDAYEASPSNQSMSWTQYSDYMLQNGCKCID